MLMTRWHVERTCEGTRPPPLSQARALLPAILKARGSRLHLVVSTLGNTSRFQACTGLTPDRVLRVPPLDGYPAGYEMHRDGWRDVAAGDVVLVCAGPLGRILAAEWCAHI
jgi:hypothetical protein